MTAGTASFTSVMKSRTPGAKSPAVMTTSVLLLTGIYVLTNVAVLHCVPVTEMMRQTLSVAPLAGPLSASTAIALSTF
jgi:hypothetical protein